MSSDNVLEVRDLVTYFFLRRGVLKDEPAKAV